MDFFSPEFLRARYDYNPDTGEIISKKYHRPVGRVGANGYVVVAIRHPTGTKSVIGHRLAWQLYYGRNPVGNIDHINNDRSDNRITNLRECTQVQNVGNYGTKGNNTSGYRGVYWSSHRKKWIAQLGSNGKRKNLGGFEDPAEAYAVYCKAAAEYYGDFFDPSKGDAANDNLAPPLAKAS